MWDSHPQQLNVSIDWICKTACVLSRYNTQQACSLTAWLPMCSFRDEDFEACNHYLCLIYYLMVFFLLQYIL